MQLFYQPEISKENNYLTKEESHHCIKVLRQKLGEIIFITDGAGNLYRASITHADPKQCRFEILGIEHTSRPASHIHIAISPTKNSERIEWFVEKAVEIGVQEISFVITQNSERKGLKPDRIIRKAISAMKQSQQVYLPVIHEPIIITEFLGRDLKDCNNYIANVDFENANFLMQVAPPKTKYCILIGPEGDFTEAEVQLAAEEGFQKVSLGNSRLRTETAGLVACHILNLINI